PSVSVCWCEVWSLLYGCVWFVFFFFQAEDGIRDRNVTGVQTCALPIWVGSARNARELVLENYPQAVIEVVDTAAATVSEAATVQIGRASCRERVDIAVGGVAL